LAGAAIDLKNGAVRLPLEDEAVTVTIIVSIAAFVTAAIPSRLPRRHAPVVPLGKSRRAAAAAEAVVTVAALVPAVPIAVTVAEPAVAVQARILDPLLKLIGQPIQFVPLLAVQSASTEVAIEPAKLLKLVHEPPCLLTGDLAAPEGLFNAVIEPLQPCRAAPAAEDAAQPLLEYLTLDHAAKLCRCGRRGAQGGDSRCCQ
jgi:hypothetical protein